MEFNVDERRYDKQHEIQGEIEVEILYFLFHFANLLSNW